MSNETTITFEQANAIRKSCREKIALAESLDALYANKHFKMFMDEYLEKEPVRLVHLLGDASINLGDRKEALRNDIQERMIGIARMKEYMRNVYRMAEQAQKTLEDLDKAEVAEIAE